MKQNLCVLNSERRHRPAKSRRGSLKEIKHKLPLSISSKHKEDDRYQAIVESSDDAIISKNLKGIVTSWNHGAEVIFGFTAEEMIGQSLLNIFPRDRLEEEVFILNKIMQGEKVDHFETVRLNKDGKPLHVSVTISPVRNRAGIIVGASKIARDITPLKKQKEHLEHIAHFDSLTDLPNRLLLSDRLRQALALSERHGSRLAVLYLDLDSFKEVNDTHGHTIGDALLVVIAKRISINLRSTDTLARIGGDEFVAVLSDFGSDEELQTIIERILSTCSKPAIIENKQIQVSASIGVTIYPDDKANEDQLIRHADIAMYEAKQSGKNTFQIFDQFRDAEGKHLHTSVQRLRQALRSDELLLYFQPKVNMRTDVVIGVEALLRWQHPERGLLLPGTFLPAVSGDSINDELTIWVINAALKQMETWRQLGIIMPVSVNLGPNQLQDPHFPGSLKNLLAQYPHISPADLELEILETSALCDIDAVTHVMHSCNKLGVEFSIDDFGTGYSSLTYLKRLPARTLKIDHSFVRDMLCDYEDLAIVRGIIGLAMAFQRNVIAEGVETKAHGDKLRQLGCELAQGYGISHPMSGAELPRWLSIWNATPRLKCA